MLRAGRSRWSWFQGPGATLESLRTLAKKKARPHPGHYHSRAGNSSWWPTDSVAEKSYVESLYQRSTRRARRVFQRLALPTAVSISKGIRSR